LKRIVGLNIGIPITLLLDNACPPRELRETTISFETYNKVNKSDQSLNHLNHDLEFRDGFWAKTLERFNALNDWHSKNQDARLLHLESDILTLPSFPWASFENRGKLAWCGFSATADIGSIFFSPNAKETDWLNREIQRFIREDPDGTDMTALWSAASQNPHRVQRLPTNFEDIMDESDGIFDGAEYGMWITGQDPRNHNGFIKRNLSIRDSFASPDKCSFHLEQSGILSVERDGHEIPLHNLHIHSKREALLGLNWRRTLEKDLIKSRKNRLTTTFSLRAFWFLVKDYKLRRGVVSIYSVQKLLTWMRGL
jgi:hypothetical protein